MKTLIKLVLVLVAIIALIYMWHTRQTLARYGVTDANPLGQFEQLDQILVEELRMPKSELQRLSDSEISPAARMYKYEDPSNEYMYVVLFLDNANSVKGIAGWFFTPSRSVVATFMENHWALCGGTTSPQFRQYKLLGVTHQTAELESGHRLRGLGKKAKGRLQASGNPPIRRSI